MTVLLGDTELVSGWRLQILHDPRLTIRSIQISRANATDSCDEVRHSLSLFNVCVQQYCAVEVDDRYSCQAPVVPNNLNHFTVEGHAFSDSKACVNPRCRSGKRIHRLAVIIRVT